MSIDRIWDFLQRLSPLARSCLLAELERLEVSGVDMPGSSDIQAKLRAEFRKDGSSQNRTSQPSRFFFAPVEPLLVEGAPEHANLGRIPRGALSPIWEWISRDLLPTMARDFDTQMTDLIAAMVGNRSRLIHSQIGDQGGQISRKHALGSGQRRDDPCQARDVYGGTLGL
jgi:hypothetical protein